MPGALGFLRDLYKSGLTQTELQNAISNAKQAKITAITGGTFKRDELGTVINVSRQDITASPMVIVKIVEAETGGGKYAGSILRLSTLRSDLADVLTFEDIGEEEKDCLVYNGLEIDEITHDLTDNGLVEQPFIGFVIDTYTDGRPIVYINGFTVEDCTVETP